MSHDSGNTAERRAKSSAVGSKPAVRKKPDGTKSSADRKTSDRKKTVRKKTVSGMKKTDGKRAVSGRKKPDDKKSTAGKASVKKSTGTKPAAVKNREDESREEFEARMSRRDEERARRRAEREKKVRRQKIIMAVSSCIIVLSIIIIVVFFFMPSAQLGLRLYQGDRYTAKEDYENARSAYEKALEIDPESVEAYRGLADNYDRQQMVSETEQILYQGWEKTKDEGLLDYYCVVVLNQAVAEINDRNCTLSTVDKCVQALEQGAQQQEALKLLATCHERLFKVTEEEDTCTMLYDEEASQDTCSYTEYEQLLRRMMAVCQSDPSEGIKSVLGQYAVIDMPYVKISLSHLESYITLLTDINALISDSGLTETTACLARAKEVQDYFSKAFDEFAAGNYAYARELVSDETYQQIRDDFIEEKSGYWEGATYIPVSQEQLVLHREEGKVSFSFPEAEEDGNHKGIITVWGNHQEDDGVQRSVVSYEPPKETGAASHTEYIIQYLYSNVKINGQYVPQMNYRLDTKVTTSDGTTTNAIGDWGGEHEWEIDY